MRAHRLPLTILATATLFSLLHEPHAAAQSGRLDADALFAPDHIAEVKVEVAAEDWKSLTAASRDVRSLFTGAPIEKKFKYVKADITVDGVRIESVGIRKKGFIGSLDSRRPSLKIKFDEYVDQKPIRGLTRLTLNNNKQDRSLVSQFLTYRLFRAAGVSAPRSSFARVTVNGEYLGVYSHVESVKKPFLARSFGNKSGNLYEGTVTDFYPKALGRLEGKTSAARKDLKDVTRLANLLAATGDLDLKEVEKIVDLDVFFRFWAMEGLLRMWDGYAGNQNNFFFYLNPENGKGYFIPWGTDSSFSESGGPFNRFGNQGPTSIYAQSMLANRLYNTSGMPERYRATMQELLKTVWNEDKLIAEIDRLEEFLAPHLGESQSDSERSMENIRRFIRGRREVVQEELSEWPARVQSLPRRPTYTVPVGSFAGSFRAKFMERSPSDATEVGTANVTMQLDGQSVAFKQMGVGVWPTARSGFGRSGFGSRQPTLSLTFTATRASDDERVTISMSIDRETLLNAKKGSTISVRGSVREGRSSSAFGGFGGGGPVRAAAGELKLQETASEEGEEFVGSFDLELVEVRGGFFDRRGREGSRESDRTERRPQRANSTISAVRKALDANGDGEISAEERKRLPEILKKLREDDKKDAKEDTDG